MLIGVPAEVKDHEDRCGLTPHGVHELTNDGHEVVVQRGAGRGSGIDDDQFRAAGARIVETAAEVWNDADLVVKVKEPISEEYRFFRADLVVFTFLHLAADRALTEALLAAGVWGIAHETVSLPDGRLPLLVPMSEIAGRMAPQVGAHLLEREQGGSGVLLGGAPGVAPARVVVLGAGTAGRSAALIAEGMQADVVVMDTNIERLRALEDGHKGRVRTIASSRAAVAEQVADADVVIGAVLIPGARAPRLLQRADIAAMRPGGVLVDIAVDQGGCAETSRPTTHSAPTYVEEGVVHYCVTNMPGAVPRTSTFALANATLPWVQRLAALGVEQAVVSDPGLAAGVNTGCGVLTHPGVAAAHGMAWRPVQELVAGGGLGVVTGLGKHP